jgi:hypothetical protein
VERVWGVRTRLASCPHIPQMLFQSLLVASSTFVLPICSPVSIFTIISTFTVNVTAVQSSRTPSIYHVILEARHDACRLETRRSRRLARYNRGSTSTTQLSSVTPSRERATTAWCNIWTLNCRCRLLKTTSDHIPVDLNIIATVASDPCRYNGSVCCGQSFPAHRDNLNRVKAALWSTKKPGWVGSHVRL